MYDLSWKVVRKAKLNDHTWVEIGLNSTWLSCNCPRHVVPMYRVRKSRSTFEVLNIFQLTFFCHISLVLGINGCLKVVGN